MKKIIILFLSVTSINAFSAVSIQTSTGGDWGGVASTADIPEPPEDKKVFIDHKVTTSISAICISTNSRWGGSPLNLDRSTHIVIGMPVVDSADNKKYIVFEFPSALVHSRISKTISDSRATKVYEIASAAWTDNYRATASVLATGNYRASGDRNHITVQFVPSARIERRDKTRSVEVRQRRGDAVSALSLWTTWGKKGHLGVSYSPNLDDLTSRAGSVTIGLSIPIKTTSSASGCRYYTSPLMVFFNQQRPLFTGLSTFPLMENNRYVTWPEKDSPGYFIALDQNKDGKITEAYELFGNTGLDTVYENGFESLKDFDSNKDNQINAKDKVFSQLVLWKDVNRNGVGEKTEQIPLNQKIKQISLDYESSQVEYGKRAKEIEKSNFIFVNKKGVEQKGHVIDMWFTPIPENRVKVISKPKATKKSLVVNAETAHIKSNSEKQGFIKKLFQRMKGKQKL